MTERSNVFAFITACSPLTGAAPMTERSNVFAFITACSPLARAASMTDQSNELVKHLLALSHQRLQQARHDLV